jgi:hypothetical protein
MSYNKQPCITATGTTLKQLVNTVRVSSATSAGVRHSYSRSQKGKSSICRHGDISTPPILSAEVSGSSIPHDLDRIRLLLSPVVVPENKASDDIYLEYQLQIIIRSSR